MRVREGGGEEGKERERERNGGSDGGRENIQGKEEIRRVESCSVVWN